MLQIYFCLEFGVDHVLFGTTAIAHALFHGVAVHFGVFVGVLDAGIVGEVVGRAASLVEFVDVVPPLSADAVGRTVMTPDADTTETFPYYVTSGNALGQIIVRIGGAISSRVGTEREAVIISVGGVASGLFAVVKVHVWGKVCLVTKGDGDVLPVSNKFGGDSVGRGRPQVVLDAIIG